MAYILTWEITPESINFGTVFTTPSEAKSFTLTTSGGPAHGVEITVTPVTYEVSMDGGSTWGSYLDLGTLSTGEHPGLCRLKSNITPGNYPATLTITSPTSGVTPLTIALSSTIGTKSIMKLRRDSRSQGKYGIYFTETSSVAYYTLDNSAGINSYSASKGAYVEEDTREIVYLDGAHNILERFSITHDPIPYFSKAHNGLGLPYEIFRQLVVGLGKLDPDEAAWLIHETPEYRDTGDLDIHAVITLIELIYFFRLEERYPELIPYDLIPCFSWRAKMVRTLERQPFLCSETWFLAELQTVRGRDRARAIVRYLADKVRPNLIIDAPFLIITSINGGEPIELLGAYEPGVEYFLSTGETIVPAGDPSATATLVGVGTSLGYLDTDI